jgi:hypothetical protein
MVLTKVHFPWCALDHFPSAVAAHERIGVLPPGGSTNVRFDRCRQHIDTLPNLLRRKRGESEEKSFGPWSAEHEASNRNDGNVLRSRGGRDRVGAQARPKPCRDMPTRVALGQVDDSC